MVRFCKVSKPQYYCFSAAEVPVKLQSDTVNLISFGIAGCHNYTVGIVAALAFQCSCTCLNAFMFQTKWFVRYRYTVYHRSLHISRPVFSKQPRKDTPWLTCKGEVREVFKWLIDQSCGFVPPAFVRYWGDRLWYNASLQYLHQWKDLFVYLSWYDALFLP